MELLTRAKDYKYPEEHPDYPGRQGLHESDMPERIIIISDMQFNSCDYNYAV